MLIYSVMRQNQWRFMYFFGLIKSMDFLIDLIDVEFNPANPASKIWITAKTQKTAKHVRLALQRENAGPRRLGCLGQKLLLWNWISPFCKKNELRQFPNVFDHPRSDVYIIPSCLYVFLSVYQTITFDSLDIGTSYLHIRYISRNYRSHSYTKVVGSRSRSQ